MNFPKIPAWCLPWKARKEMARLQGELEAVKKHFAILNQRHSEALEHVEATKTVESKNKRAITALLAWIYATHKIDQRADEHGLTDILKEFPNRK